MNFTQKNERSLTSAQDMKISNKKAILGMIKENSPISRSKLSLRLKLAKATVSSLVNELLQEKLVLETGMIQSSSGIGRNAIELTFNAMYGYVLAIDMGRYWMRLAVSDLNGNILERQYRETASNKTLEDVLRHISDDVNEMITRLEINLRQILSLCVSVPGIVDQDGVLKNLFAIPILNEVNFKEHLKKTFPDTIIWIENDVNLAAVAENSQGFGEKYKIFVLLGIGSGVGCGLILNGQLFRGAYGEAGEIGFLKMSINDNTPIEYDMSSDGIVQAANRLLAGGKPLFKDVKSVFQHVSDNTGQHRVFMDWFADRVNYLIQMFSCVINPEAVILGGGIGRNLSFLIPIIHEKLVQQIQPPKIEISDLGDDVQLIGAINIASSRVLDELWT